jgi:serine/threonine-protein kinase
MEATTMLRPRSALSMRIMVGAAVLAVVLVAYLFSGNKGRIVVNVSDAQGGSVNKLEVYVDGRKTACETAPCPIDESAGTHEVKVLAEGYAALAPKAVNVEHGKDVIADFALGNSRGTGIKVGGSQPGVKLYVDDKEVGPLPQEVRDIVPGDHVIRVAGSERYQPLEKHVTVERDKMEDLGAVTLKVLKGKVTVSLGTPQARVYIVSGTDRRELPMLPISVDIDTAKSWSLEGSKPGYEDYRQPISFDDGQAEKTYTVTLEPKAAAPAPISQGFFGGGSPAPRPAPQPPPPPANDGQGGGGGSEAFLNINSIPASTCYLDGRSLGSTPKMHVSVKPGAHSVKFVDSDDGLTKTISVSVGAGETKTAATKLN